jgi:hypothetical protein
MARANRQPAAAYSVPSRDGGLRARYRVRSAVAAAEVDRQHPPAAPRTNQVAHRVDHFTEINLSRTAPTPRLGHQWCHPLPLLIRQIRRRFVFLAIWAVRPRLCSVHIQSLNQISFRGNPPQTRFSKRSLTTAGVLLASFALVVPFAPMIAHLSRWVR